MNFRRIISILHCWLGLMSGLVVFIVSVTGCIYVFKEEIEPLIYKNHYFIAPHEKQAKPISELLTLAKGYFPSNARIQSVAIYPASNRTIEFSAWEEAGQSGLWYWDMDKYYLNAYINPYTGELVKLKNMNTEFFYMIFQIHWGLLLDHSIGQPIVGIAVLIFVLMLLSGLILWWPKNKKSKKQRFWFRWKSTTKFRRKNYDLHSIAGFYVLVLALLISLTGLVWAFKWVDSSIQWLANGGKAIQEPQKEYSLIKPTGKLELDRVVLNLKTAHPKAKQWLITIPQEATDLQSASVRLGKHTYYNRVRYQYNPNTGEELEKSTFGEKNNGEKIIALNYDIHTGAILGLPGKILAFMASLICASLPVTGFMIWWGRRNKKKPTNSRIFLPTAPVRILTNRNK